LADNLPTFVVLPDARGFAPNGPANWGSAFLPAVHQGTMIRVGRPNPIHDLFPPESAKFITKENERDTLAALEKLNRAHRATREGDSRLDARIASYEMAARLQLSAPEVLDLAGETDATKKLYGLDQPVTEDFGRRCLVARRLLERGVRFVQVFNGAYAMGEGVGNWDGHRTLKSQYDVHGPILDQPAAALLRDLKSRGMLDDTLVVWTTEFGRMPTFQKGASGRDHNPKGFTVWLAGAGVKKGFSHGATDDFGYEAVDKVATIYDLHATILHILGLNHERLSFYHNGIERRLTDVHGHVIDDVLV